MFDWGESDWGGLALFIESSLWNCEHRYDIVCGAREGLKALRIYFLMPNALCEITAKVNTSHFPFSNASFRIDVDIISQPYLTA